LAALGIELAGQVLLPLKLPRQPFFCDEFFKITSPELFARG
jgi:hypothetical protein